MLADRAYSALSHLDAGCARADWVRIGMAAKAAGLDEASWLDWCATGANYGGERQSRAVWRSFKATGGIGEASLFRMALDSGWTDSKTPRDLTPIVRQAESEKEIRETLAPNWLAFWKSLGPVRGVGREYLVARNCAIPPADGDLRFCESLRHPSGHAGPGLVALVTDIQSRAAISLHRTWVSPNGNKADVIPARLLLGGHRKSGGVIRLYPDEAVSRGLGIAEGIETALSLAQVHKPVWALIDAGNLATFAPLAGVESLTIAVDHDDAGRRSADECADRWAFADREVTFVEATHGA